MRVAMKSVADRAVEWLMALIMLNWCVTLLLPGDTMTGHPSYAAFTRFGMTDETWAVVFGVAAILRLAALYINGRWPRGPYIRMAMSSFGAVSWAQISIILYVGNMEKNGVISTGPGLYLLLAIFEIISVYRAAFDARYQR